MSTDLDRLIHAIETLSEDEQRHLRDLLNERLPAMSEDEFEQQLLRQGVLSHVPQARDQSKLAERELLERFPPLRIESEPLSETIIKDRR